MPRFGFVGDEAVLAEQNMAQTPQREEPPPAKHVKPTEQRSLTTETFAEPDAKAKIAPPEGGDLETLVEQETAHEVDVDLTKEVSDETVYTEEKEKAVIVSTVRVPVVGSEEDRYLLDEVATNWTTGKGTVQTARCISAIRSCLLQGIKQATIANYVAHHGLEVEDQDVEAKRIKDCAYRINKSLKESGESAASKSIAYPRNAAAISDRDDTLQNTIEVGMASLGISAKAKEDSDSTQSQDEPDLMESVRLNVKINQIENEQHWMAMWLDARIELKKLRENLKGETDEKVKDELKRDIDGLKKKKDEWAKLLGMKV